MTSKWLELCGLVLVLLAGAGEVRAEDVTLLRAREGAAALLRGQYDKAVAAYDEALTNPEIADFVKASIYSDRGVAKWRLKQTKEAVDDFNQSIQISPENATVYNNRGNALMDLGHPDEAVKDFDRAIALSPNYGAAFNNRGNVHTVLAQYEPAFQDFRKAVELMPTSAVPFNGRGKAHAALKRYHAALRDFTRAIGINTKYEAAYHNRGEAYLALEEFKEAADDFTQALAITPDQPDLLLLRARAYNGDKKFNTAVDDLNKAIELKPDFADAYIERGTVYSQVKRLDDAIADLTHAIELAPQNVKAYDMRALARVQAAPPPVRKQQAESVVAKQPAEASPGAEAGNAGEAKADAGADTAIDAATGTEADATPETAPAAEPAAPSDQAGDAALSDAEQALNLAPDDAFALRVRADIYRAMGRNDEAIADYRRALEQDPFQSESREALVKLGQDVPQEQGLPLGPPVSDWVIKEPSPGRYIASNPKYPKLRAELEMFGAGKPRILEWSLMKDALAGIGLLRYGAGDLSEGGNQDLVYTAIVDLYANKVVSIEPYSWGANSAQWNWQALSVVVTDPDGNANEIKLRKPKPRPVARDDASGSRPVARDDASGSDSPWGAPGQGRGRRGGGGGGRGGGFFGWFR